MDLYRWVTMDGGLPRAYVLIILIITVKNHLGFYFLFVVFFCCFFCSKGIMYSFCTSPQF